MRHVTIQQGVNQYLYIMILEYYNIRLMQHTFFIIYFYFHKESVLR
jgi:hypothetical protein